MKKREKILFSFFILMILLSVGCKEHSFESRYDMAKTDTVQISDAGNADSQYRNGIVEKLRESSTVQEIRNEISEVTTISTEKGNQRVVVLDLLVLMLACSIVCYHLIAGIWGAFTKKWNIRYRYNRFAIRHFAIATLASGYVIYFIGFFFKGTASSVLAYLSRPLLASLGMFVAKTSYSEICEECANSPFYMTLFCLIQVAAVTISAIFIVNFLMKRIKSWYLNRYWNIMGRFLGNKETLNIFWGFNNPSIILGKDIANHKEHLVYIDTHSWNQEPQEQVSLSHLFGLFPYKRNYMTKLEGIRFIIKSATDDPSLIHDAGKNILDRLNLYFLRKLMKRHGKVRMFFFSENSEVNIRSVLNICQDKVFDEVKNIEIFCHAPRTPENLTLQGIRFGIEVNMIDSSYLSVANLKLMGKGNLFLDEYIAHPVNFVDTDGRGHATSDFNAMIIGFGGTGQEALKFIYEFGSFLNETGEQSNSKYYCFDDKMDQLKETFLLSVPDIRKAQNIEFLNMSCQGEDFWLKVQDLIDQLNYVVIATGDDNQNISLATRIFEYANRYRKAGFDKFGIFVRSYEENLIEKNEEIIATLNGVARFDASSVESEGKPETGRTDDSVVRLFGNPNEIFTYKVIIDNQIKQEGDKFAEAYKQLNPYKGADEKYIKKKQRNHLLDEQSSRRKELQNFNNALHIYTKARIVGGYEAMIQLAHEDYVLEDKCLLETLAETEHLRWNASHQMLGYSLMDAAMEQKMQIQGASCNEQLKQHSCLKPYCELSEEYKEYDRGVIKTTLRLVLDNVK